jgi:hypothetical protein
MGTLRFAHPTRGWFIFAFSKVAEVIVAELGSATVPTVTVHQWQLVYPIDRKMGLLSQRAVAIALSLQIHQSMGFSVCFLR